MSDRFSDMVIRAQRFLGELAENNNRDWFEAHKKTFKTEIEAPLKLLTDLFAEDIMLATGKSHAGKTGRIYRDVRFSKDKSPYNTHVHAYWMQANGVGPGWLLQIDGDGAKLMTGLHAMDADGLLRYRDAVDRDGDVLQNTLRGAEGKTASLIDFGDATLKRVPKPYDKDHPHGDLLRRKQIVVAVTLDDKDLRNGLIPAMKASVSTLLPLWNWCDAAVG